MKSKSNLARLEGGLCDPFLSPAEALGRIEAWQTAGIPAASASLGLWVVLGEAPVRLRRVGVVAFPSGGQTITSKRVELLECVRLGLFAAEIVLNQGSLMGNLWGELEKEMRALLQTAPELETRFAVEWGRLPAETGEIFLRLLRDLPPKVLRVATGVYGPPLSVQEVSRLRAMLPKGVRLKAVASKSGPSANELLAAGADLAESEKPPVPGSEQ